MTRPMVTQAEIEAKILKLEAALEDETDNYRELCDAAANAEADWKAAYWRATMAVASQKSDERSNAQTREAKAALACLAGDENLYRNYRLSAERQKASAAAMRSLSDRLDAWRSLGANVRGQVSYR